MVSKEELNKRLNELKNKLIVQSKDAHFAKALIDDLLSVKGQLSIEPTELDVGKKIDEFKGETFAIVKTDRGCLYHEYGGYNIFVTNIHNNALYETLADYVDNKEAYSKLEGEEKETFDLNMSAIAYCLSVPKFCFADVEFTYDIATKVIEFLRKTYEKGMAQTLQAETPSENAVFEDAEKGMENIKDTIKELADEVD